MKSTLFRPLIIVVLLLLTNGFSLVACQQNNNSTGTAPAESEVKVGWAAGPTRRGTLTLLWGCLSTIFASTWTVLHLNVPHPDEPWWVTAGRKVKWMAITVLFPEFIFSKAVCELRQAVADLQHMHVAMKKTPLEWKDTVPTKDGSPGGKIHRSISWEVDFNTRMRSLYRLFGLPALPPASAGEDEEMKSSKHSHVDNVGNRNPITSSEKRYWTLSHSIYANMGGIVYRRSETDLSDICPVTAHSLAHSIGGRLPGIPRLKDLVLDEKDIKDKSKADWLLKTIAVLQIGWLWTSVVVAAALPVATLIVTFLIEHLATSFTSSRTSSRVVKNPELFSMQWRQYESYLRSKTPDLKPEFKEFCVRDFVLSKAEEMDSVKRKDLNFKRWCDSVSQYFVIGNCIIYATARIVTLALVFSSLRSVSDKVYDDVLWTRFIPKFS
ncbi:hypothetical protein QBC43DRAFT_217806 [Cladorrhinum sp. PSN259]|nr:hypothetical protein QBC43DRAFT_217806 [Cladorrhinum sp. PSN259]